MKFKKTVLRNGLRIITVPLKDNPTVTVYCLVAAGSEYEDKKKNGISHFLEHMCFKGTTNRTRDQISFELDSIGAENNAFTWTEYTGYYAKAEKQHAYKILDIVSDVYLNPTFPVEEMEKEKGVVIEEIKMYEDLPQRKVYDVLNETVYKDQPAGRSVAGSPKNVEALKRDDLVDYYHNHYVPQATVVVVAGSFSETKIINEIKKRFGDAKKFSKSSKPAVIEKQNKPQIGVHFKETDQTHFVIGFRTFDLFDKRQPVLTVLDHCLGGGMSSRLFRKMRDELGICYYIRSGQSDHTDHGLFEIAAGVPEHRLTEAVSAILSELDNLRIEPIGKDELNKIKQYLVGHTLMGLESSESNAAYYGLQEIVKQKILTPEEWLKKIQAVRAEDVQKLAKEILTNDRLNLAVVGPIKDRASLQKALKF
jgi:predicted Zn-dependent peptidase